MDMVRGEVRRCFYNVLDRTVPRRDWCLQGWDKNKHGEEAVITAEVEPPSVDRSTIFQQIWLCQWICLWGTLARSSESMPLPPAERRLSKPPVLLQP